MRGAPAAIAPTNRFVMDPIGHIMPHHLWVFLLRRIRKRIYAPAKKQVTRPIAMGRIMVKTSRAEGYITCSRTPSLQYCRGLYC